MAEEEKILLHVEGMTCANCAMNISRMLEKKGLRNIEVRFASGEVLFEKDTASLESVIQGINNLGYKVVEKQVDSSEKKGKLERIEIYFLVSLCCTLPLLAHMLFGWKWLHQPWIQLALCLPSLSIGLAYFGKSAIGSLRAGDPNMDVLVLTGSLAAFVYSIAGMVMFYGSEKAESYLFFETSSTIITFVLLGNIIEKRSLKKTRADLDALIHLQPLHAKKILNWSTSRESITEVHASQLIPNDLVLVNTGDQVPADGKIFEGTASIDESMLTGESIPVMKSINDTVMAGTIVTSGNLKIFVEKTSGESVLSKVIELVRNAQHHKPAIQKLGDRVSAIFVPAVILIAFMTFLLSRFFLHQPVGESIMRSIAVLVISCPCAMGLATPAAVSAGIGRAARNGILVRSGSIMEEMSRIRTVVFDKTGTLTNGKFKISQLQVSPGEDPKKIRSLIFELEKYSSHPLAVSITEQLELLRDEKESYSFRMVNEEKGLGIFATGLSGEEYRLGSELIAPVPLVNNKGHAVYLFRDQQILATIDVEDSVRNDAAYVIENLNRRGIRTVIISGDSEKKCATVASELGIKEVYSRKLPHEKLELIASFRQQGKTAMVGDGINDAPALAASDVGISFGNATAIAINAAQVILPGNEELKTLIRAFSISEQTMKTIKQNLFWAFFYNIVAIPIAAAGLLSPIVASFSMAFSDVIVIGNSILLRFRKF